MPIFSKLRNWTKECIDGLGSDQDSQRREDEEAKYRAMYGTTPSLITFNKETTETMVRVHRQMRIIHDRQTKDAYAVGYPTVSPDAILAYYRRTIRKLLGASGLTREDQYTHVLGPIRRLAWCVHLLPASGSNHHCNVGGLFEHSLEVAFYAAEAAKGQTFSKIDPLSMGRVESSQWQLAVILCALFHDVGKVMTDCTVKDWNREKIFDPNDKQFYKWLQAVKGDAYYVYWNSNGKEHEMACLSMISQYGLITEADYRRMGGAVNKELHTFFRKAGHGSRFADIVNVADMKSSSENLRLGQFNRQRPIETDRTLVNVFTAMMRLLFIGDTNKNKDGRPELNDIGNGYFLKGWDANHPDSAIQRPDNDHLFIRWDSLTDLRIVLEVCAVPVPFLDLTQQNKNLTDEEVEEDRKRLVTQLHSCAYLEVPPPGAQAGLSEKGLAWKVRPRNKETGSLLEAIEMICLNKLACSILFKHTKSVSVNPNASEIDWGKSIGTGVPYTSVNPSCPQSVMAVDSSMAPEKNDKNNLGENKGSNYPVNELSDLNEEIHLDFSHDENQEKALLEEEADEYLRRSLDVQKDGDSSDPLDEERNTDATTQVASESAIPIDKEECPENQERPHQVNLKEIEVTEDSYLTSAPIDSARPDLVEKKPKSAFMGEISLPATRKSKKIEIQKNVNNSTDSEQNVSGNLKSPKGLGNVNGFMPPPPEIRLGQQSTLIFPSSTQEKVKGASTPGTGKFSDEGLKAVLANASKSASADKKRRRGTKAFPDRDIHKALDEHYLLKEVTNGQSTDQQIDNRMNEHQPGQTHKQKAREETSEGRLEKEIKPNSRARNNKAFESEKDLLHTRELKVPLPRYDSPKKEGDSSDSGIVPSNVFKATSIDIRRLGDKFGKMSPEQFIEALLLEFQSPTKTLMLDEDEEGKFLNYQEVEKWAIFHEVRLSAVKVKANRHRSKSNYLSLNETSGKVRLSLL